MGAAEREWSAGVVHVVGGAESRIHYSIHCPVIMSYSRTVPPRAPTKYQRRTRDDSSDHSDESPAATPPVRRGAAQQSTSYSRSVSQIMIVDCCYCTIPL